MIDQNPVNGDFWFAYASAAYEAGDYPQAIQAGREALDLRHGFLFESALLVARSHARLDDRDQALDWLQTALSLGLRNPGLLPADSAFACLNADDRFHEITGIADFSAMTRTEGWRHDVRFFAREFRRLAYEPFHGITAPDFETAIAALEQNVPAMRDAEILRDLSQLVVTLGDGHAYVFPAPDRSDLLATLPLQFHLFEEGLFVVATRADLSHLHGAEVLAFDDTPIDSLLPALTATIGADNASWPREIAPYALRETPRLHALGLIDDPLAARITLRDESQTISMVRIEAGNDFPNEPIGRSFPFPAAWPSLADRLEPKPLYLRKYATPYWFDVVPELNAVYLQFNVVRDMLEEPIRAFTERLFSTIDAAGATLLIIDLRWNKGGNTTLEWPFLHRLIGHPVNRRGSLFAVIGRRTFSAAQNFATYLDLHTSVIFAGEPTGSSPSFTGENIEFQLPYSKSRVNISDLYWQSGWPYDRRTWIAPELYAPPTFAAFREGRDVALEAIISALE